MSLAAVRGLRRVYAQMQEVDPEGWKWKRDSILKKDDVLVNHCIRELRKLNDGLSPRKQIVTMGNEPIMEGPGYVETQDLSHVRCEFFYTDGPGYEEGFMLEMADDKIAEIERVLRNLDGTHRCYIVSQFHLNVFETAPTELRENFFRWSHTEKTSIPACRTFSVRLFVRKWETRFQ
jgi:hypothetical protein